MMDYDQILCKRVQAVPPSGIRKFFDIVSEMKDAISLGVGEPDFATPWRYTDAAIYSLKRGHTHYTSNWGLLPLREAISRYEAERFGGVCYDPKREILVTVGASEGIDLALRSLIEPGDEVLAPDPTYVSYAPGIAFAGGVCKTVKTSREDGFRITPNALKSAISDRTKALILPYPNNPTGSTMDAHQMAEIAEVLRDTNIIVIADEIYAELSYGHKHVSFAAVPGMRARTITLNGFSKAFAMTGWRLGYACGPAPIMELMVKIHQYTMLSAPTAAQYAALEALRSGFEDDFSDVRKMVSAYDRRRRFVVEAFNRMGLECVEPLGAFYAFPSIRSTNLTSEAFCTKLLASERVAVVPGNAFGEAGEGYIRASYASSMENLQEAMKRIARFVSVS